MRGRFLSSRSQTKTKETFRQALCYVLAFVVTYTANAVILISLYSKGAEIADSQRYFFICACLSKIFLPIQGLWNLLIFIRPRYVSLARKNPHLERWFIIRLILTGRSSSASPGGDITGNSSVSGSISSGGKGRSKSRRRGSRGLIYDFMPEIKSLWRFESASSSSLQDLVTHGPSPYGFMEETATMSWVNNESAERNATEIDSASSAQPVWSDVSRWTSSERKAYEEAISVLCQNHDTQETNNKSSSRFFVNAV